MEKLKFKRNWCDYLTKCPYKENIMIGEYECSQCECNCGLVEDKPDFKGKCNYAFYTAVWGGECQCSYNENKDIKS